MSFVDMGLKIEFNSLLDDYRSAFDSCQTASRIACRVFDRDPVAAVDLQQSVDKATFALYIAKENLFDFFMDNLDHFIFDTADADTVGSGMSG